MPEQIRIYLLSAVFCLVFFANPAISGDRTDDVLETSSALFQDGEWAKAEGILLRYLWNHPYGETSVVAASMLSRINVYGHKGPEAMEWLETALNNPDIPKDWVSTIENRLRTLQRIYLPGQEYRLDRQFRVVGIELESPRDLALTDTGRLIVLDRYRMITLAENESMHYQVIPPASPLPERVRSLKLQNHDPVIITETGYWQNHALFHFHATTELTRIIDAVFTIDQLWFVLDRRNTNMFVFDANGRFIDTLSVPSPSGDEQLLRHGVRGFWILMPSSRQIVSAGSAPQVTIPFKGPGYTLVDPVGFATDWFGHLYILNRNKTVTVFSPRGIWLQTLHLDPRGDTLRTPTAIAVSNNGSIYVTDRKRHDIFCYR